MNRLVIDKDISVRLSKNQLVVLEPPGSELRSIILRPVDSGSGTTGGKELDYVSMSVELINMFDAPGLDPV